MSFFDNVTLPGGGTPTKGGGFFDNVVAPTASSKKEAAYRTQDIATNQNAADQNSFGGMFKNALSSAGSQIANYAQAGANLVVPFGNAILHPIDTVYKIGGIFQKNQNQAIDAAGEALYNQFHTTGAPAVANFANLITSLAQTFPTAGISEVVSKIPGLNTLGDVANQGFGTMGKVGSIPTGFIIDRLPMSQKTKDVLKEPLQNLTSFAAQAFLGEEILREVNKYGSAAADLKVKAANDIVAKAKEAVIQRAQDIPQQPEAAVTTPTQRHATYAQSQGYEPYTPTSQLPTIDYGTTPKSTIPSIQTEAPQAGNIPGMKYEPVRSVQNSVTQGQSQAPILNSIKGEPQAPILNAVADNPIQPSVTAVPLDSGIKTVSKLASDIAERIRTETPNLASYETKPGFMEDQAQKALDFRKNDPANFKKVAMGEAQAPQGLKNESVFVAARETALRAGDTQALLDLSKSSVASQASIKGQDIKALDVGNSGTDPVRIIQDVRKSLEASAEKQNGPIRQAKEAVVKDITTEIKKAAPTKQSWAEFVDSIACGY